MTDENNKSIFLEGIDRFVVYTWDYEENSELYQFHFDGLTWFIIRQTVVDRNAYDGSGNPTITNLKEVW